MNAFLNFNMHSLVANCGCLHMLWGVAVINRHDEKPKKKKKKSVSIKLPAGIADISFSCTKQARA